MVGPGDKPKLSTKLFYGSGSVAYGVKDSGFAYFLLFYYSNVLGLAPQLAGLAILLALVFDAFSDPLVGHFSDQLHSKWGRRHPFMYASIIPVGISYFLMWNPPQGLGQSALFFYMFGMAVLVRTCITFFEVPSTSMVAELTDDYDQRTSMLSFRYFFGWWGGLTIAVIAYGFFLVADPAAGITNGLMNAEGYRGYGLVAALIMMSFILISSLGTHRHIPNLHKPPPPQPFSFSRTLRELRETLLHRPFLALFFAAVVAAMAQGVITSLSIYFNNFFWQLAPIEILIITLSYFIAAFFALILAPIITKGRNKRNVAVILSIISICYLPLPMILRLNGWFWPNDHELLVPTLFMHGVTEGTIIIMISIIISSMVADVVESSEMDTGRRSEGLFFSARSFAGKVVHGIGVFIAANIVAIVGIPRGADPADVDPNIMTNFAVVYVPTIMLIYFVSVGLMSLYKIKRDDHGERTVELKRRRAAAAD